MDIKDIFKFEQIEENSQSFVENCSSCSRQNIPRNHTISRVFYRVYFGKFHFDLYRRLKVECQNCHKIQYLPASFARIIFRNGLKSRSLMSYIKDPFVSSWFVNFLANSWRGFGLVLGLLTLFIMFRFFYEPVILVNPSEISFDQLKGNSQFGKIVKVKGKVDYPLALTKDEVKTDQNGNITFNSREVYFPIFSEIDATDFAVVRGGSADLSNISGRVGISNPELLKNQDYEVIGRIESIDKLSVERLRQYFLNEIPSSKATNKPEILINSSDIVTLESFLLRYANSFILLLILTFASVALQIYLDKKINQKTIN